MRCANSEALGRYLSDVELIEKSYKNHPGVLSLEPRCKKEILEKAKKY